MVGLGVLLILVGIFYVVPRGAVSGSAAMRVLRFGMQGAHQTPGDPPEPANKRPWIKQVMGAGAIIIGIGVIHFATN